MRDYRGFVRIGRCVIDRCRVESAGDGQVELLKSDLRPPRQAPARERGAGERRRWRDV